MIERPAAARRFASRIMSIATKDGMTAGVGRSGRDKNKSGAAFDIC
jgi:hypothetical protein